LKRRREDDGKSKSKMGRSTESVRKKVKRVSGNADKGQRRWIRWEVQVRLYLVELIGCWEARIVIASARAQNRHSE
jgi:hypothetical protein